MPSLENTGHARRVLAALALAGATIAGCEERPANTTTTPAGSATPTNSGTAPRTTGPAAGTTVTNTSRTTQPDNTARNERDGTAQTPTPMDQGESEADRRITAEIRRAVVGEQGLSTNAQNVKIITRNGAVTLRGPVATQAERDAVERLARAVPGVTSIVNEIEITNR